MTRRKQCWYWAHKQSTFSHLSDSMTRGRIP
jgi:hypothetical protein